MVGTSEVIKSPFLDLDNGAVVAKILADDFDPTSVVPEPLPTMPHQDFQTRSSFDSELAAIDDLPLAPSD